MQQVKTIIHWYHGWGGHPDIWQQMIAHVNSMFNSTNICHLTYNRGYYSVEKSPDGVPEEFDQSARHIIVSHSMGGMFVPQKLVELAEQWFMISGFRDFHEVQPILSRKALNRMIDAFKTDPAFVLQKFFQNMMSPSDVHGLPSILTGSRPINNEQLLHDLILLNETVIPSVYLADCAKLTIFHGEKDVIVSPYHAEIISKAYSGVRVLINQAGHGIPLTHSAFIIEHMQIS